MAIGELCLRCGRAAACCQEPGALDASCSCRCCVERPCRDAAQARGEVATNGGDRSILNWNTAADIGISSREIHDARAVRDAEAADPGTRGPGPASAPWKPWEPAAKAGVATLNAVVDIGERGPGLQPVADSAPRSACPRLSARWC
jgi:hypothetical protein